MSDDPPSDSWEHLDTWWTAYESSYRSSMDGDTSHILSPVSATTHWESLDSWWRTYTIVGQSTAEAIATFLAESTDRWRIAPGPFDTDPLATPAKESSLRGPLQPDRELQDASVAKPQGFTGNTYPTSISNVRLTGDPKFVETVAALLKPIKDLEGTNTRVEINLQKTENRDTCEETSNYPLYLSVRDRS